MSVKQWVLPVMLCLFFPVRSFTQDYHLFRLYEDNDFINLAGKGTDKGYTNGTRFDYFLQKKHISQFFLDHWFPQAGEGAVNTYNYSLMQIMLVPNDLSKRLPDKDDWPYSGSLVLSHGLYSTNPEKKYALFTELTAGVIGPPSLAKETQTLMHSIIHYTKPMGWAYQMPTDVLLNITFMAEKMIWQSGKVVELMGGGQVQAGTMYDNASVHLRLRAGKMQPYFSSYIGQYASPRQHHRRLQYYVFLNPTVGWWAFDALLQGGVFAGKSDYYAGINSKGQSPELKRVAATADAGATLVWGNFSISVTQKELSSLLHNVSDQTIGNISMTLSW